MVLVYVTNAPQSLAFFTGHIRYMKARGFEVHVVSAPGELLRETGEQQNIPVHAIDMPRQISPISDLVAITKLYRLFRILKPTIVHANFPKGGLLGVIAARLARVPVVVYGMRGLIFESKQGARRGLLLFTEAISCGLAHLVICNSFSNRARSINLGLCQEEKIRVLAQGSSNGVDAAGRFNPRNLSPSIEQHIRDEQQIPGDAQVVGFVGRIVRDKGIVELESAWQFLKEHFPNLFLLLVGPVEGHDPVPPKVLGSLRQDPRVRLVGAVRETPPFYAAMNILVLPSHREGFPNTPLEAAAMELPVVSTKVDGCVDAVVDGVTGLLVPPKDPQALAAALERLILDPELRQQMGQAGRQRVLRDFRPEALWQAQYQLYRELIGAGSKNLD